MRIQTLMKISLTCVVTLLSGAVHAHEGHEWAMNFTSGFIHPLSGVDHLLAMLMVGVWSTNARTKPWFPPLIFMVSMLIGTQIGQMNVVISELEFLLASSLIGLGLMVGYLNKQSLAHVLGGCMAIAFFGFFHGWSHGLELNVSRSIDGLIGMMIASAVLHSCGWTFANHFFNRSPISRRLISFASMGVGGVLISSLI